METKIREMHDINMKRLMLTLTLMTVIRSVDHNLYCTHGIFFFILAISEGIV